MTGLGTVRLQGASLHDLPPRSAMGLPDHLVERVSAAPLAEHGDLLAATSFELAALVEEPTEPFARRWAAGTLLGLLGDPRTPVDAPSMVDVPSGRLLRGTPTGDVGAVVNRWSAVGVRAEWISKEVPRTTMEVSAFRIARYAVTNAEWRRFCHSGDPAARLPSSWHLGCYPVTRGNHPVWTVEPEAADAYAAWLSQLTERCFRLPSEAEWEYAARGSDAREYPWGDKWDANRCNTVEAGPLDSTPVGLYPAGAAPFGALDMAGNVEEYVADDYGPYVGASAVADDLVGALGPYRVARGGSFSRFGDLARCARRHGRYPGPLYAVGLRLAEDPLR